MRYRVYFITTDLGVVDDEDRSSGSDDDESHKTELSTTGASYKGTKLLLKLDLLLKKNTESRGGPVCFLLTPNANAGGSEEGAGTKGRSGSGVFREKEEVRRQQ
jgi:hypothetical protein